MKNVKLQESEVLKSVKMVVCGMKCVDLYTGIIRITGVHFLYDETEQDEKNSLETILRIQNVLKI